MALDKRKESGTGDPLETLVISDADGQGEDCHPWSWGGGEECAGGQAQQ